MSVGAFTTTGVTFGKVARVVFNIREEVKFVAGSKTDAGADAVALAIRDLIEEIRRVRWAVCSFALLSLDVHAPELTKDELEEHFTALDALRKLT